MEIWGFWGVKFGVFWVRNLGFFGGGVGVGLGGGVQGVGGQGLGCWGVFGGWKFVGFLGWKFGFFWSNMGSFGSEILGFFGVGFEVWILG